MILAFSTEANKKYLIGVQHKLEKKGVGEHKGNQYLEMGQNDPIPTAEKIGKQHGLKMSPSFGVFILTTRKVNLNLRKI